MDKAPVIENPAFCLCGKKRLKSPGELYSCLNCDRIHKQTEADAIFTDRMRDRMTDWYPEQDLDANLGSLYQ